MVASEYTGHYRDVTRPADVADWIARPIIVGGHQPELFHPGVWLKNSVLDAYARQVGGTAINLVVDSDRCARASVGVPVGTPAAAHVEDVPFDAFNGEMAWEERPVADGECFASFGDRASRLLEPLVPQPILRRWWPLAVDRARHSHRLGLGLAQARHMLEERFGLETLELPVSELVRLPTVMVFIGWLLAHARLLHESYNEALLTYRRERRVRGRGRPMPDLAVRHDASGEWIEVPWWIWSREDPRRRRVFANTATPGVLALSDMETLRVELPIAPDTSPSKWVDGLSRMEEHAIGCGRGPSSRRSFRGSCVADVFVHGIGGAAYDGITDDIVRRHDRLRSAPACRRLGHAAAAARPRVPRIRRRGSRRPARGGPRDAPRPGVPSGTAPRPARRSQPDRCRELIAAKRRWIETHPTVTLARRRCREIRATNERLAVHTRGRAARRCSTAHGPLAAAAKARKVLRSREYPWCFFPENALKTFLLLENGADPRIDCPPTDWFLIAPGTGGIMHRVGRFPRRHRAVSGRAGVRHAAARSAVGTSSPAASRLRGTFRDRCGRPASAPQAEKGEESAEQSAARQPVPRPRLRSGKARRRDRWRWPCHHRCREQRRRPPKGPTACRGQRSQTAADHGSRDAPWSRPSKSGPSGTVVSRRPLTKRPAIQHVPHHPVAAAQAAGLDAGGMPRGARPCGRPERDPAAALRACPRLLRGPSFTPPSIIPSTIRPTGSWPGLPAASSAMSRSCRASDASARPPCAARCSTASPCCPSAAVPATASGSSAPPRTACGRSGAVVAFSRTRIAPSFHELGWSVLGRDSRDARAGRPTSWRGSSRAPQRDGRAGDDAAVAARRTAGDPADLPAERLAVRRPARPQRELLPVAREPRRVRLDHRRARRPGPLRAPRVDGPDRGLLRSSRATACSRSWPTRSFRASSGRSSPASVPRRSRTTARRSSTSRAPPIRSTRPWPVATSLVQAGDRMIVAKVFRPLDLLTARRRRWRPAWSPPTSGRRSSSASTPPRSAARSSSPRSRQGDGPSGPRGPQLPAALRRGAGRLLLGQCDPVEAVAAGRLEPRRRWRRSSPVQLFPRTPLWCPMWDDLPA